MYTFLSNFECTRNYYHYNCVLIVSQVTVTTPPVTVVCSGAMPIHYDGYDSFHLCGPDNIRSAWCGSATTVDSEETMMGSISLTIMTQQQQPQSQMPSGICQLCHWSSIGKYLFQSWASHCFLMSCVGFCYGVCFLLSGSHVTAVFTNWGSTIGVCDTSTLWSLPLLGICASLWWSVVHTKSALIGCSPTAFSKLHATHSDIPPAIPAIW